MTFHVEVHERAQEDTEEIFRWLKERSIQGAATWLDAAQNAIDRLAVDALRYPVDPRSKQLNADIRLCPFQTPHGRTYLIVYTVDAGATIARVIRIRGPGQRPIRSRDLPPT
jgi:plasmid stabilization system protein ParE